MSWEWDVIRLFTAVITGAALSFAGTLVQITTRNELASPSTLGMDGLAVLLVMAGFGLEAMGWGWGELNEMSLALGFSATAAGWAWSRRGRWQLRGEFRLVLLMGLAINLLVGAFFAIMQFLAMAFNQEFPEQLWFGRLRPLEASAWGLSLGVWVPLLIFVLGHRRHWKVLLLGPSWCRGLGVPMERMQRQSLVLAFLATLWVVTQFGVFSFLGLLCPLLLRQLNRYRGEPWREMTDGAVLAGLSFALLDHVCFNLTFHGAEIPVGLPAGLFGAAALVGLLAERTRKASE